MSNEYREEIVYTESEDGLLLEGAVISPAAASAKTLAVVWVHGLTGKFYSQPVVQIGRNLASRGYTFVTGNNRGHDFGALYRTRTGERLLVGGGWERFDEAPRDIASWIGFAVGLGFRGVALLGHSLGGLKVAYYQAQRDDSRVAGLIAASPPLRAGRIEPERLALAERLAAEGRGTDLLPWGASRAGAGTTSAQAYLNRRDVNIDVYGSQTADPVVAKIRCPILAFYGTNEAWVGGDADLEIIRRSARSAARVDTRLFEGADHNYGGHEVEIAATLAEWVDGLG